MENNEMVKLLAKLQVLCMRYVERNTQLRCYTMRDMERIITANKLTCNYGDAVDNLYDNIKKYCGSCSYLMDNALQLKEAMHNSDMKNMRFGIEPVKKFTEQEKELDSELIKNQLFYTGEMVGIKDIVKILGNVVTESAVKQACQQERLLNTKKLSHSWIVHIEECRAYWNVPDTDDSHLYKNWIY